MSEASQSDRPRSPRRIRSMHRRRIISRLTEGEATVSELSFETGLRMPHTSAEIRRMREEELVSSDLPPGSRGSKIRLTENGWRALEDDEWSKILELENVPVDKGNCCILFRDGSDVTLCFLSPPEEPMVLIPNRVRMKVDAEQISSRNQGVFWNWAVLSERNPRWFNKEKLEVSDSPPELAVPGSIESYVGISPVFGVIRAKLLNPENSSTISPGEWFSQPEQISQTPLDELTFHRGRWILGSPHSRSPDVRPSQPVAAIIRERLPRSVLLRSARADSLVVADLSGLDAGSSIFPIGALDHWIGMAHPRLSEAERKRRLGTLRDRISTPRKVKVDESTLRKFRKDWGDSDFTSDDSSITMVNLRGMGKLATESLIRWSIDVESIPLVIEIDDSLPGEVISKLASHPKLRLILMKNMMNPFSSFDTLEVDAIRTLPWMIFSTNSGLEMPVRLVEHGKIAPMTESSMEITISPLSILGYPSEKESFQIELKGDSASIVSSALSQYPNGNEEWANQMEAMYPLASWIASPKSSRWQRWQRLSSRIAPEWLALLDIDHMPIEKISELADQAPESVRRIFSEKITSKLREDPDNLLRSWPAIDPNQANRGAAWLASHFIQNSAWLPEDSYPDLLDWAVEAWLSHPPVYSLGALIGLDWLLRIRKVPQEEMDLYASRIRERSTSLPENHNLNTWSKLYGHAFGSEFADLNDIELIIRNLPLSWWSPFSSEFLLSILESNRKEEMLQIPIPWCAAILRPEGEKSEAPGLSSISHKACSPDIIGPLHNLFRTNISGFEEGVSISSLWDLMSALESIRSESPPPAGRSHRLSGWLAQPYEKWPIFTIEAMMEGDNAISERLILGKSGFHPGLYADRNSSEPLGS